MSPSSHTTPSASRAKPQRDFSCDQSDLFQRLEQPANPSAQADLNVGPELLGAINTALRQARVQGLGRERVVGCMNRLLPDLEHPVTLRQLNAWTANSKEYHEFPARWLPAFCAATDCDLPLRVLAQAIGRDLVDARELAVARLGETRIQSARLRREARALEQQLITGV